MRIVVLTGAGISAESGLGTFRDKDGLWSQYDLSEVATPEGYAANPKLVLDFYNARRENALAAKPNEAHFALAKLEAAKGFDVLIVTQNIDSLHEQAGSTAVTHIHGSIIEGLCAKCGAVWETRAAQSLEDACASCGKSGGVRPNIVWFGEVPYALDEVCAAIEECDLFVSIGTSGTVYPAAGFVSVAKEAGAETLELNLEASDAHSPFDEIITGPATEIVPAWVEQLTGST